jgi:hypothetical protein
MKNEKTLENLKRSMEYMLKLNNRSYQYKILYSAFKRAEEILRKKRNKITSNPTIEQLLATTNNEKHKLVLKLLFVNKLKPKQIVNLKDTNSDYLLKSNRGKKYTVRSIQKIRENAIKSASKSLTSKKPH